MSDQNNINDASAFADDTFTIPPIIKVIGVGGGGGNAVDYLYSQGVENVTFMVCNTDKHALRDLKVPTKILLGDEGLGAGDNPEKGQEAAERSADEIRRVLSDDTKMVFITAGMGGGTGTGAGPVVARIAQECGLLTIGIVTIPFFFEGKRKILKALKGAEEMREYVDTLLIVNNERLTEIYKDLTLINAFSKADDTLANATSSIARIINTRGYINADFNDVQTTLKDSKTAVISTGYGEGEHRVTKAIQDALNSPLLRNSDIRSSKRLLFYLYFNPKAKEVVTMSEMNEITEFSSNLNPTIGIKWGACWDESLGESVKITILASGFDISITDGNPTGVDGNKGTILFEPEAKDRKGSGPSVHDGKEPISAVEIDGIIDDQYGTTTLVNHTREMDRARYVVLNPLQFDNDDFIARFEKVPTYSRDLALKELLRSIGMPAKNNNGDTSAEKAPEKHSDSNTTTISFG